ncbi:hypothetical protein EBM89_09960 [Cellulomonas triticagri]|uniref:Pyrrolo-quinoline quinone repeat domain-containing protein n=2 Tax=Cellulomonas triticagri TaxID=2483352 RepID=A0A3M2JGU5_9CELL|nr:hypothetical protein EBM89_09960 [Cellulomonas triticagri]
MDDVELVEVDGADAPDDADPRAAARRARTRRLLRRWWPVPVVAVLGVVGWQALTDARERAVVERLREVDGVIGTTVTPPLTATPWGDEPSGGWVGPGSVEVDDGAGGTWLVGASQAEYRSEWSVSAVDPRDGTEEWRVGLGAASGDPAFGTGVGCWPEQEPARAVWCEIATTAPDGTATAVVARVDGPSRSVTSREVVEGEQSTVAGGGLMIRATRAGDVLTVRAVDGQSGEPAWTTDLDADAADAADTAADDVAAVRIGVLGTHPHAPFVWVRQDEARTTLLDLADGRVVAEGAQVVVHRGAALEVEGSNVTRLLGADGTGSTEVDGQPVVVGVDDGSAPGTVLLHRLDGSATGLLRAVDRESGAVLWEQPDLLTRMGSVTVLDGVVYGSSSREVWAVDLRTGDVRWRAPAGVSTSGSLDGPPVDGVSLLRVERDPDSGDDVLAAYRLRDGARLWAEPMPAGVNSVASVSGTLFGFGDGVVVLD